MKIREIAEFLAGELIGDGDAEITSVADISAAKPGQIVFWSKPSEPPTTAASCIIAKPETVLPENVPVISVSDPKLAFALVAAKLHPQAERTGRHETAVIDAASDVRASFIGAFVHIAEGSTIGEAVHIHEGARIGRNVTIGQRSIIHSNVVIYDGVKIGNDCIIHSGSVIGADGFGFVRGSGGVYRKFPQIGTVTIEDCVEIGANSCVDRGALGQTRIGKGTKIDNLVQIGHNANIGQHCVIAAQTGVSGSVVLEDGCIVGGQAGFGDHAHVKSGAIIGAGAGVLPGKIVRPGVWWGTPVQPLETFKRRHALLNRIEKIVADIASIKNSLKDK